ncbi:MULTISPECIES: secretion protein [Flavobacterium]|uniref:secretion protein n=1 Tax=Flavobacterium TaxID=237 RepID=UPI00188BABDD|nr:MULTISPECIES: secretion protein [Flavobacterium]MBF4473350.1 secretion protein [Flavobacterium sp. HJJ]
MKTILKLSLVVLVTMTGINTYAINDDFLLNVKKGEGKEISFSVNEIKKANVTIYDQSHNIIYNELVTGKEGIARAYNLEEFPEGVYFLEVETNLKKVVHEIVVADKTTTLSRKSLTEVYKGDLKIKNQNVAEAN